MEMTFKSIVKLSQQLKVASEGNSYGYIPMEFYRRPRTKNRRIIKKWMGRIQNWRVEKRAEAQYMGIRYLDTFYLIDRYQLEQQRKP